MHGFGCACALAPKNDRIVRGKGEAMESHRSRCRHQDKARPGIMIGYEGFPRGMTPNRKVGQVVESGALEAPVIEKKTARLDQVDLHSEAGRKPQ